MGDQVLFFAVKPITYVDIQLLHFTISVSWSNSAFHMAVDLNPCFNTLAKRKCCLLFQPLGHHSLQKVEINHRGLTITMVFLDIV
jgi:hypothetical protein